MLGGSPLPLLILPGLVALPAPFALAPCIASALALLHLVGALLLGRFPPAGRLLLSAAILGTGMLMSLLLGRLPLGALGVFVAVLGLLSWIWGWTLPSARPTRAGPDALVRGAAWSAGLICVGGLYADLSNPWVHGAVCAAPLIAVLSGCRAAPVPSMRRAMALVASVHALLALLLHDTPAVTALVGLGVAIAVGAWAARSGTFPHTEWFGGWSDVLFTNPSRALVVTFLVVVMVGTALLALPFASTRGPVGLVDALFTSTSATCVTGLIVLDTPNDFSVFGQVVLLCLIQVGGLGIMIFSVVGMAITGRRLSVLHESAAVEIVGTQDRSQIIDAARVVLAVTFIGEAAGGLLLSGLFALAGDTWGQALWRGVFTAISAFCNAGFALQTDNLVPYQSSVGVLLLVALLIVTGGLGPAVVRALPDVVRRRSVSLQVRLVLWTTGLLLLSSTMFVLAVEWRHSLAQLGPAALLANALFAAVTPRTAGFNSLEMSSLRPATLWITMGLMFVGGSPSSTAGGIKTTTCALLTLMIHAALSGRAHVRVFGARVHQHSVYKAAAIATLALLTVAGVVAILQLTQKMPLAMAAFESISALGTVGLSTGGTAGLDVVGKLVIAATMFAGRVGPLTLFMFLSARAAADSYKLPEAEVAVG